jgi:YihY family inner membrane protein
MASETHNSDHSIKHKATGLLSSAEKGAKPMSEFFRKFGNDWATTFSAALAYSLLTAMLPIAIAIVAVLALILTLIPGQQGHSTSILNGISGIPGLGDAQQSLVKSVTQRLSQSAGFLTVLATILAIFGGSRLFVAMENSMDIIYRVRPRPALRQNLVAIGMMLIFTLLVPIMVFAATLPSIILNLVKTNPELKAIPFLSTVASNSVITVIAGYAGGLLAAFLLFEAIYMIVPNQRIQLKKSWQGAIVAAILLELFIALFPTYIGHFMTSYAGQIAFTVVLLAFFYYFALILMLGAEVNAFFFEGVQPLPNNLATFIGTMGARLNHDRPEEESPHHIDPKPTEKADDRHIARSREQEEDNLKLNMQKQEQYVQKSTRQEQQAQNKQNKKERNSNSLPTTIAVIGGSALALLIETLRLRQGK